MYNQTYLWYADGFDAIVNGEPDIEYDVREDWKKYVLENGLDESRPAIRHISTLMGQSYSRRKQLLTELAYVASTMDPKIRESWLAELFNVLVQDSENYQTTLADVSVRVRCIEILCGDQVEPALFIESESEHAKSVAFSIVAGGYPALFVQRSPRTGHMQVYGNVQKRTNVLKLAILVRMAEYQRRTGKKLTLDQASGVGTIPQVSNWYVHAGNTLMCGSLSVPSVTPTVLTLAEMEKLCKVAFHPYLFGMWIKGYRSDQFSFVRPKVTTAPIVMSNVGIGESAQKELSAVLDASVGSRMATKAKVDIMDMK
jgi:hypothetical protein